MTSEAEDMAEWSASCAEMRYALERLCADVLNNGTERTRSLLRDYLNIHSDLADKLSAEVPA